MEKLYSRGDVVFLKNQKIFVLGRGYSLDLRVNGHPFIIIRDVYELGEKVPCLLMSSKKLDDVRKKEFEVKNLALRGRPCQKSYVDIGRIYYVTFDNIYMPQGSIKKPVMEEILKVVKERI